VNAGAVGSQTARLRFEFTAHSTGQQGVALVDNIAGTSGDINVLDTGTTDNGNAAATVVDESQPDPTFVKGSIFYRSVDVSGLEAGENVVLRSDVRIACNGQSPTGNMQARLASASVVDPADQSGAINTGDQTVPFKRVGDIKHCDPKDPTCE
jgi:hypothetical protein